ncbi:MAG: sigma-70 family RNA polymerase sigma factor [Gemmatimonadetes bacterium]|nr:sigma-70 family RNA polymerase sigma factor [Gemmatimonadota bacterium]
METTLAHSLPTDERTLVRRAQAGDVEAFGALVSQYMRRAYYAALGLVGSHDDALDLSQEAFSRAFRARMSLDPNRSFYTWLYTILRRLCFNFLRDRKAQSQKLAGAAGWLAEEARARVAAQSPVRAAELAELRSRVAGAIEQLPDRQREVLVLKEFEGLRYREIAELLGIPIGTVMSRLYAARRQLAGRLEESRNE